MVLAILPVTPESLAEVGAVIPSVPLSSEHEAAVLNAVWTYAVLVHPDQQRYADQYLACACGFEPLEVGPQIDRTEARNPDRVLDVQRAMVSEIGNTCEIVATMADKARSVAPDSRI